MADNNSGARKRAAVQFLELVVAARIEEAYQTHVDMRGKHHNPFFTAGFPALKEGMLENQIQFPIKKLIIKKVLGDGDLVAVHSHIVPQQGETGFATVHLFRFQGDKIVEMWDIGQPVPANSPNNDSMF